MSSVDWPCLAAARRRERGPRWPLSVADAAGAERHVVGSVDDAGRAALRAWPERFALATDGAVTLVAEPSLRDALLAEVNAQLHRQGLIVAWRDEPYPLLDAGGILRAVVERASARFWGSLTFGAHVNGYVAQAGDDRPTHLWIARRAWNKPTDPGRLDNLIGGGVPHGQTPSEAVLREGWEEAGLSRSQMAGLRRGRVIELACDIAEGWQHEWLYVFDLALPPGLQPRNQDGEVAEHRLLPIHHALQCATSGEMTTDAALATLDFALRHGLLPAAEAAALSARLVVLCVGDDRAARFDRPDVALTFSKSETPPQSL